MKISIEIQIMDIFKILSTYIYIAITALIDIILIFVQLIINANENLMIELIELYQAYYASSVLNVYWPRYINNIISNNIVQMLW